LRDALITYLLICLSYKKIKMKKIFVLLPVLFLALTGVAQTQTEDDASVGGKSKTFGKYRGIDSKNLTLVKGQTIITGTVINVSWCEEDCFTILVKTNTGNLVTVGTKDYAFSVPKQITGKKISIEGIELAKLIINKKAEKKQYQKDIQIAATGIKIYE
jgi:hypothetical protein